MTEGDSRNTPRAVVEAVRRFYGGAIDLDPCSNPHSIVSAGEAWELPVDGLALPWFGRVFCNPPWSEYGVWAHCAAQNTSRSSTIEVCFWCPNNTETADAQTALSLCDAVCFWRARVAHPLAGKMTYTKKGRVQSPKSGNMMLYFGWRPEMFQRSFAGHGASFARVNRGALSVTTMLYTCPVCMDSERRPSDVGGHVFSPCEKCLVEAQKGSVSAR